MTKIISCAACNYTRKPTDDFPEWFCPKCQKAYNKTCQSAQQAENKIQTNYASNSQQLKTAQSDLLNGNTYFINSSDIHIIIDNKLTQIMAVKIEDPIVKFIGWVPIAEGTNICTHELIDVSPERLEFRATNSFKGVFVFFIISGLIQLIIIIVRHLIDGIPFITDNYNNTLGGVFVGLLFITVGVWQLNMTKVSIIFNLSRGVFGKGKIDSANSVSRENFINYVLIKNIHAFQIIAAPNLRGDNSIEFFSYELNLVTKDAKRINVINHGSRDSLVRDAKILSNTLKKPVWDAIDCSIELYKSSSL